MGRWQSRAPSTTSHCGSANRDQESHIPQWEDGVRARKMRFPHVGTASPAESRPVRLGIAQGLALEAGASDAWPTCCPPWKFVASGLFVTSAGGCLFVDEIDTGLHYSVMAKMWHLLIETARRLDVQVFASTHSLDCLQALARVCQEKSESRWRGGGSPHPEWPRNVDVLHGCRACPCRAPRVGDSIGAASQIESLSSSRGRERQPAFDRETTRTPRPQLEQQCARAIRLRLWRH